MPIPARKQERLFMGEKDSLLRELDHAKEELGREAGSPRSGILRGRTTRQEGTSLSRTALDLSRTLMHETNAKYEDEIKVSTYLYNLFLVWLLSFH